MLFHCMVRHGTVNFFLGGGGVLLGTVLVPDTFFSTTSPWLRFQANRHHKTWRANHWLTRENRHCLHHWTCNMRHNRPTIFKSAQPVKDRTQLFWTSAPFLNNPKKMAVSLSVEEVQTFLSLIAEEQIQRELNGATENENVFQESQQ